MNEDKKRVAVSDKIQDLKLVLSILTTDLQYAKQPELEQQYGSHSRHKCQEEVEQYLEHLAAAVLYDVPSIFTNFISWSNTVHLARNVPTTILIDNLECMAEALRQKLPEDMLPLITEEYLNAGLELLRE